MAIKNLMTYEPQLKELKKESDIIDLFNDVGLDLHCMGLPAPEASLKRFLEIIEDGKYEIKEKGSSYYNSIDLSKAQSFVTQYKYKSEKGCQSCQSAKYFKPLPDETLSYCSLSEKEEDALKNINTSSQSLRIKKYYEKGCDQRKPVFRPLEELLKNY